MITTRLRHFGNSNNCSSVAKNIRYIVGLVLGICILIYILHTSSQKEHCTTQKKINEVSEELDNVKQQNKELKTIIENYLNNFYNTIKHHTQNQLKENSKKKFKNVESALPKINNFSHHANIQPSLEYEQLRRRFRYNTQELWYYFSNKFEIINNSSGITPEIREQIQNTLELGGEYKRSIISSIDRMRMVDGYETWRQKEAENLSDLLQRRLHYLQNPKDCKNAKKLVCNINRACGYGCQLHHLVYCFIVAYATERTMIIKSKGWKYHRGGWKEVFQPISETCTEYDVNQAKASRDVYTDAKVLLLPVYQIVKPPPFLSLAIPEDIAPQLIKLHYDPVAWWIGQFFKYLFKPNYETQRMLEITMSKLGWKKPIVGVHIRRTDKINEAPLHSVEEYMKYVDDYYLTQYMNNTKLERRVFIATDDPLVINEARTKYPQYRIIGDIDGAQTGGVSERFKDSALRGVLLDVHMLSLSDYLVCTLSSNLGRLAFEVMQNFYPDTSDRFKSLDRDFSFANEDERIHEVILPHQPRNTNEIEIEPGDLIKLYNNNWNGFSKGLNKRTQKPGLIPNFKIKHITRITTFPTYPYVD